jgi:hypothetical protein
LLHVITHDLGADPPVSFKDRLLDFGAAALGVVLPALASLGFDPVIGERFLAVMLDFAPALAAGWIASLVIRMRPIEVGARAFVAWTFARRSLALEAVLAVLVFLGAAFSALYVIGAAAIAGVAALFTPRSAGPSARAEPEAKTELLPWALVGAIFASFVGFEPRQFGPADLIGGTAALAWMTFGPIAARAPLVALLAHTGFPIGIAFFGLVLDVRAMKTVPMASRIAAFAAVLAASAGALFFEPSLRSLRAPEPVSFVCLGLLALWLARDVFRAGARAHLATLME